ncbi:MAG TPA: YceI family protein [Pirellulales bacterium]|jgi:polyisoprenoid-binding protein YceI|nr:YceI family protein [Pirellulales bacterium]
MTTAVATYVAANDQSRFSVQAFAGGLLSSFAHNPTFAVRNFSAKLEFDAESPGTASIEVDAKAQSLELTDNVKAADREEIERQMRSLVLETTKYPQITYRSTEIASDKVTEGWFRLRINGELMLHGVTKNHAMEATVRTSENKLRFTGETSIRLCDFRMKKISALAGTITLKEEVKLTFDFAMS